jgi:predicted NBD/HSP70 family sugar kinase
MRKINLKAFTVATSLTARDINRRIMLNVIRTRQPISRADVARYTGLQRSTVSLIADQLIREGWVIEGALGRLPRGRRPIFLQLNTAAKRIIGVNIRPENTEIALADITGHFLAHESFGTPQDPAVFIRTLARRIKTLIERDSGKGCEGIGIGLPGRADSGTSRLIFVPNLPWEGVDLKTPLERATHLPVAMDNAANACALAEMYFANHSEDTDCLIAVTVSEGIGTGIVSHGQLLRDSHGLAGEFGHMTVEQNGLLCRCGNQGCWEMYASNRAAIRYWKESGAGNEPGCDSFEHLLLEAEAGDPLAVGALEQMGRALGVGMANLIRGFSPAAIVVVGEVTRAWSRIGPVIQQEVQRRVTAPLTTRIQPTDEALQPRLRGTIALVLQQHVGAPAVA